MIREIRSIVLLMLVTLLILWPRFGHFLLHPNGYLLSNTGDGLKNYFLFGYYVKWDQGLSVSGLNYPYGEHLLFTDSHPMYAGLLNLIDNHLLSLSDNAVAFINLAIVGGIVLGVMFIYLILKHYHLPSWYAGMVAICIALLSPQIDRIHGHLSLSYVFAIPLFWWLLLKAEKSGQIKWYVLMLVTCLVMGGTHLYYVGMYSAFLGALLLVKLYFNNGRFKDFLWDHKELIACLIIPLVAFQVFAAVTDPFWDRPSAPYGFYAYYATLGSVFLPHYSSLTQLINNLFEPRIIWEGRAFVGTIPLIFTVATLILTLASVRIKVPILKRLVPFRMVVLAASMVLLYAMCIPFRWGLQFITDLIPALEQFRALGRFAWIFYYVISVVSAYYLFSFYRWVNNHYGPLIAATVLAFCMLVWAADAGAYFLGHTQGLMQPNTVMENTSESYLARFESGGVAPSDFQGIMTLPMLAIRTDKMVFERDYTAYHKAMQCAWHTGIPIVQSSTSRPSFSQSFSNIQLVGHPWIPKTRIEDMDERPLLLISPKGIPLTPGEQRLVDHASVFWQDDQIKMSRLPLSAFESAIPEVQLPDQSVTNHDSFGLYRRDSIEVWYEGYNDLDAPSTFRGGGARFSKDAIELFKGSLPGEVGLEASFWVFIDPSYSGMPVVAYQFGNKEGSAQSKKIDIRSIPDIVDGWVRVYLKLEDQLWHEIHILGHDITVDELLIKPINEDVKIVFADSDCLINNYPVANCD